MDKRLLNSLHRRGVTQKQLARVAGVGRSHLSQVLSNKVGRGECTRRRLYPYLTRTEIDLLGWRDDYDAWEKEALPVMMLGTPSVCST